MSARSLTWLAIVVSLVACAHRRAPEPSAAVDGELATRLVAWDVVRRRAESNLLTVRLPRIAVREDALLYGTDPMGFAPVAVVAIARRSPHFASVQMVWPMICEQRGELPDDVFDYAMAWCRDAREGGGDLEAVLVGLLSSRVPRLREAALTDLINVVADAHDAETAMRILARTTPPPGTLDKLAAVYAGLGRAADEEAVRKHLPPPAPPQRDCGALRAALHEFEPGSLVTVRAVAAGSTTCAALARTLLCRIAAVSEAAFASPFCRFTRPVESVGEIRVAHLLAAYANWGRDWSVVADHAARAMPEPGAEQVAIAALSASLRAGCEQPRLARVQAHAHRLLGEPAHDARWTSTLEALAAVTPEICNGLSTARRAP